MEVLIDDRRPTRGTTFDCVHENSSTVSDSNLETHACFTFFLLPT